MYQISKKDFKARTSLHGRDQVLIYPIAKIDLQMINVQMVYSKFHLFMNLKKENKKYILHIVYHIHTQCSITILTKM